MPALLLTFPKRAVSLFTKRPSSSGVLVLVSTPYTHPSGVDLSITLYWRLCPFQENHRKPRRESMTLTDKVAIVTGSGQGIVKAMIVRMAVEGASVVVRGWG